MSHPLNDKVIIVTGASSGIGAATARRMASLGCKLTLAARSTDRLQALAEELGPDTLAVPTDVTNGEDVARMVAKTIDQFGAIDVLFANAGIYIPGQVIEGDPNQWATLTDVNIDGVFRCVHADSDLVTFHP